ncbi:MAG: cytochrome P450 [Umezawaea sp.]
MSIDLTDPDLLRDPFAVYSRLREETELTRGIIPGVPSVWLATRYDDVKLVMSDPRFVNDAANVPGLDAPNLIEQIWLSVGIPAEYLVYLLTGMGDSDGANHARLRKLVTRAFTAKRVAELRPRIKEITERLLDELPDDDTVDLLAHFAYPLPISVICELVGIPEADRPRWRAWSAVLARGMGPDMGDALRGMIDHATELIDLRRTTPTGDLLSDLVRAQDDDRLSDVELVTLVLNLVVAGHETTAHLIANGTAALLTHPDQLTLLRNDSSLLPRAVQELMRWCGPVLGTRLRYATEDVKLGETLVHKGEAVMPVLAGANYDPRAYDRPDRLDLTRDSTAHAGFGHGPHYCLGAALARQEGEIAFEALLRRFPHLTLAVDPADLERSPNLGTWQLAELPVRL